MNGRRLLELYRQLQEEICATSLAASGKTALVQENLKEGAIRDIARALFRLGANAATASDDLAMVVFRIEGRIDEDGLGEERSVLEAKARAQVGT